jgi:hypothetical protein
LFGSTLQGPVKVLHAQYNTNEGFTISHFFQINMEMVVRGLPYSKRNDFERYFIPPSDSMWTLTCIQARANGKCCWPDFRIT